MLPNQINMVGLRDYQGVEGFFGAMAGGEVDLLNKALAAGSEINAPSPFTSGDGFALRVESLEATLKVTTYKMRHLRFFRGIPKAPAFNTVEEFNRLESYGLNEDAGFIAEGDLPNEDDSLFSRQYALVKFLGTTRRVTHPLTLVKTAHGPAIAQETTNGTMHLLKMLERALFYGNHALCALQFDGFEKLITDNSPASNIVDLRGAPMSEDVLTDGAAIVSDAPNYGTATHLHLNLKVKNDLTKTFFPKERGPSLNAGGGNMVGLDIKGFTAQSGDIQFEPNVFINDGGAINAAAVGEASRRPAVPVAGASATPPAALSQFVADDAGNYFVSAVACNRYGRSAPVAVDAGAAIAVAAGDEITFNLTPGSTIDVEWYDIYRTRVGAAAGTMRRVLRVPNLALGGAQTIHEYNANIPGCTSAFMFQQNLEAMCFKQLAPMVKIPLAVIDSSIRWMQLLYGVPILFTPGKVLLYKNVGRASGSLV